MQNTVGLPVIVENVSIAQLFVIMKGAEETDIRFIRLVVNPTWSGYSWPSVKSNEEEEIRKLCLREEHIPIYWTIHVLSKGYLDHSIWREAFLNAVIACESCLYIYNYRMLEKKGISKTKLDNYYKDEISFGFNIDILRQLLADNMTLSEEKIGKIRNAKKKRNDIVHGREVIISREDATEILSLSREFIESLEDNAAKEGIDIQRSI